MDANGYSDGQSKRDKSDFDGQRRWSISCLVDSGPISIQCDTLQTCDGSQGDDCRVIQTFQNGCES